jgi:hypothetical protein
MAGKGIIPIRTSDTLLYDDYEEIVGAMGVFHSILPPEKNYPRSSQPARPS